jgi:hypothetical protein
MKKSAIVLLGACILLGTLMTTSAYESSYHNYIGSSQVMRFTRNGTDPYWAMVHDYTHAYREGNTPGFITSDYNINYTINNNGEIHVGYAYCQLCGIYVRALASRHVVIVW